MEIEKSGFGFATRLTWGLDLTMPVSLDRFFELIKVLDLPTRESSFFNPPSTFLNFNTFLIEFYWLLDDYLLDLSDTVDPWENSIDYLL